MDPASEVQLHYVMVDLLEVRQAAGHIDLPCVFVQDSKSGSNTISFHTSGHIKPFEHLFQAHKIN